MPKNSTNQIAVLVEVVDASSYEYSLADDFASCRQIPTGGTMLSLPDDPNTGDSYGFGDADGTCSDTHPLILLASTGTTIRGDDTFSATAAYSAGRVEFDGNSASWIVTSETVASGGGGGGPDFGSWQIVTEGFAVTAGAYLIQTGGTPFQIGFQGAPTIKDGDVVILNNAFEPPGTLGASVPIVGEETAGLQWTTPNSSAPADSVLPQGWIAAWQYRAIDNTWYLLWSTRDLNPEPILAATAPGNPNILLNQRWAECFTSSGAITVEFSDHTTFANPRLGVFDVDGDAATNNVTVRAQSGGNLETPGSPGVYAATIVLDTNNFAHEWLYTGDSGREYKLLF